jgi:predicted transcriptional regulator
MNEIGDNHYILEFYWMTKLGLTTNELRVYALIYSYSQDGQGSYYGSIGYIQERLSIKARSTVFEVLKNLVKKNLIEKNETYLNNQRMIQYKVIPNQYMYGEIEHPIRKSDTPSLNNEPEGIRKSDGGGMKIGHNNISYTKGFISNTISKDEVDKRNRNDKKDKNIYTPLSQDNSFDFNEIGKNHIFTRYLIHDKYLTLMDQREYFKYDRLFQKMMEQEGWTHSDIKIMVQYFLYHYHERMKVKIYQMSDGSIKESKPTVSEKIENKYAYFVAAIKEGKKALNKQNQ